MKRVALLASLALGVGLLSGTASANTTVTTPNGTWVAHPGQSSVSQTSVQQPMNADGSSNFKHNSKAVIPVKFGLSTGTGPFVFESIWSDNPATTANDYSFLTWIPDQPLTFAEVAELSAGYAFTDGDCAGGSLRWTVYLHDGGTTRNLDVHYQPGADGLSQQICAAGTSGQNLIGSTDTIYVTQEFNGGYSFPSAYNNTYADAVSQLGGLTVEGMSLIVDSGWGANGDQVVDLTNATVGVNNASPYTETFTPQPASALSPTCNLPQASIKVTKLSPTPSGAVNDATSIQPFDDNELFRVVDCKYMYNLATSSLLGAGRYRVEAVINGTPATGAVEFDLRA